MVNNLAGVWQRATFTVPNGETDEAVQFRANVYKGRFGQVLEAQGFTVKEMLKPQVSGRRIPIEEGRRRYDIFAFVSREPVEQTFELPDKMVPEMLAMGLKLK